MGPYLEKGCLQVQWSESSFPLASGRALSLVRGVLTGDEGERQTHRPVGIGHFSFGRSRCCTWELYCLFHFHKPPDPEVENLHLEQRLSPASFDRTPRQEAPIWGPGWSGVGWTPDVSPTETVPVILTCGRGCSRQEAVNLSCPPESPGQFKKESQHLVQTRTDTIKRWSISKQCRAKKKKKEKEKKSLDLCVSIYSFENGVNNRSLVEY